MSNIYAWQVLKEKRDARLVASDWTQIFEPRTFDVVVPASNVCFERLTRNIFRENHCRLSSITLDCPDTPAGMPIDPSRACLRPVNSPVCCSRGRRAGWTLHSRCRAGVASAQNRFPRHNISSQIARREKNDC